ncbi:MAG: methyltransferase domain-containing protein [Polyangia bacterium]
MFEPSPTDSLSPRGGILRAARRPAGWVAAGPPPETPEDPGDLWPGPGEDLCWLAGNWRILQRLDGHRTSLDDLVTAHMAASLLANPASARWLDLGTGIGSVALFLAWRFPQARGLGVEVQEISAAMARRSLAWNGAAGRVEIRDGDFRDPASLAGQGSFDLVTGTPPYFPVGTGPQSDREQRAPCRFEHHGGVEAYCEAAARVLAPAAPLVACQAWIQRERVEPAGRAAGLALSHWREVIPREGKAPLFVVFAMTAAPGVGTLVNQPPLVVRDREGRRTPEFVAVRQTMGMPA